MRLPANGLFHHSPLSRTRARGPGVEGLTPRRVRPLTPNPLPRVRGRAAFWKCPRWRALHDGIASTLIALVSMVRGLSLLLSGRPRTPLRILCIVAFDTLHTLRCGKWLPMRRLRLLAALLDFGACANATLDRKVKRRHEHQVTLQLLEDAGIGPSVAEYLRRLSILETGRPLPGGDRGRFQKVSLYREAVVRLSLGIVATTAAGNQDLDKAIEATHGNGDLNLLFRIVMQCQIIDDVLDYFQDKSAGLPTFLTACESLPQALALAQRAARDYADDRHSARTADVLPLQAALVLVSMCTDLIVSLRRHRQRVRSGPRPTRPRRLTAVQSMADESSVPIVIWSGSGIP
jgi:hypothetical protein